LLRVGEIRCEAAAPHGENKARAVPADFARAAFTIQH
jgi:hypothetical protein